MFCSDEKLKSKQSLIFLHIPKTAGTTLHQIIEKQYESTSILKIGINTQKCIDKFKNLPEKEREKFRVIKGHMAFGLHEFLPQPCTYITMLRDPIDRVISSYYYVLRAPVHYLHEYVTTTTSRQMSLKDFVCSGICTDLDNGQTRRLAGVSVGRLSGSQTVNFGESSTELLEKAKENLTNYFSVVGTLGKFDEFLLLAKQSFGWSNCYYARQNVTNKRPLKEQISEDTLETIEKYNQLDIQLYKFVQDTFQQHIEKQPPHFDRELEKFRAVNGVYSRFSTLSSSSRSGMIKLKGSVKKILFK